MMTLPLKVAAFFFAVLFLLVVRKLVKKHGLHWILWRAATGHHLDGKHRTNRGWARRGTRSHTDGTGNAVRSTRWSRAGRLHRAAVFWAVFLTVAYTLIGLAAAPALTVLSLLLAAATVSVLLGLLSARWWVRRPHRRHMVTPAATVMAARIGQSPQVVAANLKIRPNLANVKPGDVVVKLLNLPDTFTAKLSDQQEIEEILSARIPVELNYTWDTHRHPMRMTGRVSTCPPPVVKLADYEAAMDALTYGQYFIGCGDGGAHECWDSNVEDPHLMDGGRSRKGKTNLHLCIACQALRRGERVSAVDPKRVSLRVLVGVPGFRLANDPRDVPGMWRLIKDFWEEMNRAIDGICLECGAEGVSPDGGVCGVCGEVRKPHTLILEEINQLFSLFRDFWEHEKEPKQRITDVPAWRFVKDVVHQGAQFGYRVVVGGQDLKDNVLFGARSQFGLILMTGFTPKQWGYAVGTTPVPRSPSGKGRFHLVRGSEHTLVQVVCADPRKGRGHSNELAWREFALNGRMAEQEARASGRWQAWQDWRLPIRRELPGPGPEPAAIPPVLIGPKQAADYLGMTYDQFKMARRKTPILGEFKHRVRNQEVSCWAQATLDLWAAEVRQDA